MKTDSNGAPIPSTPTVERLMKLHHVTREVAYRTLSDIDGYDGELSEWMDRVDAVAETIVSRLEALENEIEKEEKKNAEAMRAEETPV